MKFKQQYTAALLKGGVEAGLFDSEVFVNCLYRVDNKGIRGIILDLKLL